VQPLLVPVDVTLFVAGLCGATAFAFLRPDRRHWGYGATYIFIGTTTSLFCAPAVCELCGLPSRDIHLWHLTAFGVGLVGTIMCRTAVAAVESDGAKMLLGMVRRMIGLPPSGDGK
jgi:hypothetical protein